MLWIRSVNGMIRDTLLPFLLLVLRSSKKLLHNGWTATDLVSCFNGGQAKGGNYHFIDNHIIQATRFLGKFTDFTTKVQEIEVFED